MTDIARLGIEVKTGAVEKATSDLKALAGAAKGADIAATKLVANFTKTNSYSMKMATSLNQTTKAVNAVKVSFNGLKSAQTAVQQTTNAVRQLTATVQASSQPMRHVTAQSPLIMSLYGAFKQAAAGVSSYVTGLKSAVTGSQQLVVANQQVTQSIGAMRANQTNLIAQFQDIGVTAAMGMSPALIAMQQGSQIALVMADNMRGAGLLGAIKQVGVGLASMLGPVMLVSIAIAALFAVFIQWVDWTDVAKKGLMALADVVQATAEYVPLLGAALAIAFAPQILSAIGAVTKAIAGGLIGAIKSATVAMIGFAMANPFAAFALLVAGALVVMYQFRDEIAKVLGFDIFDTLKKTGNYIIGLFVQIFNMGKETFTQLGNAIAKVWSWISDKVYGYVKGMMGGVTNLINLGISGLNKLGMDISPITGTVKDFIKATDTGVDYIGDIMAKFRAGGGKAADTIRTFAGGIGKDDKKKTKTAGSTGKSDTEKYGDIISNADLEIANLQAAQKEIGLYGEALYTAQAKQKMLSEAQKQGLTLTAAQTALINEKANAIGRLTAENERLKLVEDALYGMNADIVDMQEEIKTIGLLGEELYKVQNAEKVFADARRKGIELTAEEIIKIKEKSAELAKQRAELERIEFMNKQVGSYKTAMQGIAEERAEVGMNVAQLEAYRFVREAINAAERAGIKLTEQDIAVIKQQGGAYGQAVEDLEKYKQSIDNARQVHNGFWQDLFDGARQGMNIFKAFGEAVINTLNRIADKLLNNFIDGLFDSLLPNLTRNSKGNVYEGGNLKRYAKGGVVTTATEFNYSGGTGLAGEAGPEAIIPLKRGADGSLGVQMQGNVASAAFSPTINIANDNRVTGAISSDDIVELQKRSAEKTKKELAKQLPMLIDQWQRDGAMA